MPRAVPAKVPEVLENTRRRGGGTEVLKEEWARAGWPTGWASMRKHWRKYDGGGREEEGAAAAAVVPAAPAPVVPVTPAAGGARAAAATAGGAPKKKKKKNWRRTNKQVDADGVFDKLQLEAQDIMNDIGVAGFALTDSRIRVTDLGVLVRFVYAAVDEKGATAVATAGRPAQLRALMHVGAERINQLLAAPPRTTGKALADFPKLKDAASAPLMLTDESAAPAAASPGPAQATALVPAAEMELPARFVRRGGGKRSAPEAVPLLADAAGGSTTRARKKKPQFDLGHMGAEQLAALAAQATAALASLPQEE